MWREEELGILVALLGVQNAKKKKKGYYTCRGDIKGNINIHVSKDMTENNSKLEHKDD